MLKKPAMHIANLNLASFGHTRPPPTTSKSLNSADEISKYILKTESLIKTPSSTDKLTKKLKRITLVDTLKSPWNPYQQSSSHVKKTSSKQTLICPSSPNHRTGVYMANLSDLSESKLFQSKHPRNFLYSSTVKTVKKPSDKSFPPVCPTCQRRMPLHTENEGKLESKVDAKIETKKPIDRNETKVSQNEGPMHVSITRSKKNSKIALDLKIEQKESGPIPFVTIGQIRPQNSIGSKATANNSNENLGLMICIHDSKKGSELQKEYAAKFMQQSRKDIKKDQGKIKLAYRRLGVICRYNGTKTSIDQLKKTKISPKLEQQSSNKRAICHKSEEKMEKSDPNFSETDDKTERSAFSKTSEKIERTDSEDTIRKLESAFSKPILKIEKVESGRTFVLEKPSKAANIPAMRKNESHMDPQTRLARSISEYLFKKRKIGCEATEQIRKKTSESSKPTSIKIKDATRILTERKSRRDIPPNRLIAAQLNVANSRDFKPYVTSSYEPSETINTIDE